MNNNRKNQHGGVRENSGRPKGTFNKPQIRDFITEEEVKKLVILAKKKAGGGDTNILKFLLEQVFGKAHQTGDLEISGGFDLVSLLKKTDESNRIDKNLQAETD